MHLARIFSSFVVLFSVVLFAQSNTDPHTNSLSLPEQPATLAGLDYSPQTVLHSPIIYPSGGILPLSVAVADVNGDGLADLIVGNQSRPGEGNLTVFLGHGDGSFDAPALYDSGGAAARCVAVGDLNGDGFPDIVVANDNDPNPNTVGVLINKGDGTFLPAVTYGANDIYFLGLAVGDMNGDGKLDIITAGGSILLGNGDGTFQPAVQFATGRDAVAVADVNGDGNLDAILVRADVGPPIMVALGNGDGTFQDPVPYFCGAVYSVAVADLNGDGKPDIVVSIYDQLYDPKHRGAVGVLFGNGDGTFQPAVSYDSGARGAVAVAIGDINGDGKTDVVVGNSHRNSGRSGGTVGVLLGNGDGTFQPIVSYLIAGSPAQMTIADINGGSPDLLLTVYTGMNNGFVEAFSGPRVATTTKLISSPNPSALNQPVTFTATVTASAGIVPDGREVTFYDNGTAVGTAPTLNGIATFTTSSLAAGKHTIKASLPRDSAFLASKALIKQVVNPQADAQPQGCWTSVTLSTSGSPSRVVDDVTFTANTNALAYCHHDQYVCGDGEVDFYDDKVLMGSRVDYNCQAVFDTSSLTVGKHHIKAVFNPGSREWNSSSARLIQEVIKWDTTTTAGSLQNPSSYGQPVTLTALVVSTLGDTMSGQVKFFNGGKWIGTANVDPDGNAALTTKRLVTGTNAITAEYLGGALDAPSTSPEFDQVVTPAATTTTIASSKNPSKQGQNVTFRATVTSGLGQHPGGSVTFTAGTATLGTVPLTGIHASISTNALAVGSTVVTATYSGSADFTGSSGSLTQVVNP